MYTDFASVYDRLMGDVPYEEWARYYADLLAHEHIGPGSRVVECACGTGSITIPLARLGYRMTGADLSPEMLNLAQQKARNSGVMIPFIRMDMRTLSVQRPVDAVLATCDGPNYLLKDADLLRFFQSAYMALKPSGILAFDVSTPYKLSSRLGDRLFTASEDDLVYVWQGQYDEKRHLLDIHLDIFTGSGDEMYRRIQEDQRQRAYTQDELMTLLDQAGFSSIRVYGDRTLVSPELDALRWHIIAQKGANC